MMESRLADKVVLVTGGSRGLGAAIASRLATEGAQVAVNYSRDQAGAEEVSQNIRGAGGTVAAFPADVSESASAERLVRSVEQRFGSPVQILVNNAGVIPNTTGWMTETAESLSRAYQVNAMAAVFLSQLVQPGMIAAGWGRIINITSIYGDLASPSVLSYCMSKAAMDALTRALAVNLGGSGITVNSVAPGNIDTAMTRNAGPEYIADVEARTPLARLGRPAEVADAVLYLCQADFITGVQLVIDGGLSRA